MQTRALAIIFGILDCTNIEQQRGYEASDTRGRDESVHRINNIVSNRGQVPQSTCTSERTKGYPSSGSHCPTGHRGNCQQRQGLRGLGGWGTVLTNDKTGTVKDIPSYSETECAGNWLSRGLEKHTVGIYGLRVRLEGMARKGFPVFYNRLSFEYLELDRSEVRQLSTHPGPRTHLVDELLLQVLLAPFGQHAELQAY